MARPLAVGAVVAALIGGVCGCGQSTTSSSDPPAGDPPSPRATLLEWDKTGATSSDRVYRDELAEAVAKIASERGEVLAVALDGQPLTTAEIEHRNFAQPPPEGSGVDTALLNEAVAHGFARRFLARARRPEEVVGSGQLQGLELASALPAVTEVILWSDAVVNEAGFNLTSATTAEVHAEVARWRPKLAGLRNKTVVIVGGGRGVHQVVTVERARQLFHELVGGSGGHLIWTPTLSQRP